jgi:hypothetical protein
MHFQKESTLDTLQEYNRPPIHFHVGQHILNAWGTVMLVVWKLSITCGVELIPYTKRESRRGLRTHKLCPPPTPLTPPHIRIGTCTSESSTKKTTHNLCVGPTRGKCSQYPIWAIICVKVCGYYLVRIQLLRLLNKARVALANLQMKHMWKPDWSSSFSLFSYGCRKCIFVDLWIGYIYIYIYIYICSPNHVLYMSNITSLGQLTCALCISPYLQDFAKSWSSFKCRSSC